MFWSFALFPANPEMAPHVAEHAAGNMPFEGGRFLCTRAATCIWQYHPTAEPFGDYVLLC
jgi:hypothetical protein